MSKPILILHKFRTYLALWPRVDKRKLILAKIKKKTIKNRITKKQLDRKSHQKKTTKNCIFLSFCCFFFFLFCFVGVVFSFCFLLFCFCSLIWVFWFVFWFALCFFLWNPINSLYRWTHKSSVQIIRPVSIHKSSCRRSKPCGWRCSPWGFQFSTVMNSWYIPLILVFWVLSVSVLKQRITAEIVPHFAAGKVSVSGWVWNAWSAHQ